MGAWEVVDGEEGRRGDGDFCCREGLGRWGLGEGGGGFPEGFQECVIVLRWELSSLGEGWPLRRSGESGDIRGVLLVGTAFYTTVALKLQK